jgi:hypothetical protein
MKLERIETPDYILAVSDEKPTVGNQFIYETDTQTINTTCSDYTPNEFDFIIKAYLPKGDAKELDLPLLPEIVVEDDVEKIFKEQVSRRDDDGYPVFGQEDFQILKYCIKEIITSSATKVYSEGDLRNAFNAGYDLNTWEQLEIPNEERDYLHEDDYIQSLKRPKTPKWFVAEMEEVKLSNPLTCDYYKEVGCIKDMCSCYTLKLKTKTTNNKTYLVGKYE